MSNTNKLIEEAKQEARNYLFKVEELTKQIMYSSVGVPNKLELDIEKALDMAIKKAIGQKEKEIEIQKNNGMQSNVSISRVFTVTISGALMNFAH